MSEIDFSKIEVGQWVWTEDTGRWGLRKDSKIIREVVRLTPTLIICDEGDEYDRFKRVGRTAGFALAGYSHSLIVGLATPDEIEAIGIPRKRARIAEKERRAKCDEMKKTLPPGMTAWLDFAGAWEVKIELKGISEERVRGLAVLLGAK
jgi:hypothetical protein